MTGQGGLLPHPPPHFCTVAVVCMKTERTLGKTKANYAAHTLEEPRDDAGGLLDRRRGGRRPHPPPSSAPPPALGGASANSFGAFLPQPTLRPLGRGRRPPGRDIAD